MSINHPAYKSIPSTYYTYLTKPKFKHSRYSSPSYCYELHTGYPSVDGYYSSVGEMASAVLSEGLYLKLLRNYENEQRQTLKNYSTDQG